MWVDATEFRAVRDTANQAKSAIDSHIEICSFQNKQILQWIKWLAIATGAQLVMTAGSGQLAAIFKLLAAVK